MGADLASTNSAGGNGREASRLAERLFDTGVADSVVMAGSSGKMRRLDHVLRDWLGEHAVQQHKRARSLIPIIFGTRGH